MDECESHAGNLAPTVIDGQRVAPARNLRRLGHALVPISSSTESDLAPEQVTARVERFLADAPSVCDPFATRASG
jgi:hypothetical protein